MSLGRGIAAADRTPGNTDGMQKRLALLATDTAGWKRPIARLPGEGESL